MESEVEESELVQLLKKLEEYVMNLRRVNFVLNTEQGNEELMSIKGSLFEIIGLTKGQLLKKIDALTSIERLTEAEVLMTAPEPKPLSESSQPSSSTIPPPLHSFGLNSDVTESEVKDIAPKSPEQSERKPQPAGFLKPGTSVELESGSCVTKELADELDSKLKAAEISVKDEDKEPMEINNPVTETLPKPTEDDNVQDLQIETRTINICINCERGKECIPCGKPAVNNPMLCVAFDTETEKKYSLGDYNRRVKMDKKLQNYFSKQRKKVNRLLVNECREMNGLSPIKYKQKNSNRSKRKYKEFLERKRLQRSSKDSWKSH